MDELIEIIKALEDMRTMAVFASGFSLGAGITALAIIFTL